jgi:hypothetical protein
MLLEIVGWRNTRVEIHSQNNLRPGFLPASFYLSHILFDEGGDAFKALPGVVHPHQPSLEGVFVAALGFHFFKKFLIEPLGDAGLNSEGIRLPAKSEFAAKDEVYATLLPLKPVAIFNQKVRSNTQATEGVMLFSGRVEFPGSLLVFAGAQRLDPVTFKCLSILVHFWSSCLYSVFQCCL